MPPILKTYHAESGRFGSGIFICSDQNLMYPLAVAYLRSQWAALGLDGLNSDLIASLLQYGEEGRVAELPPTDRQRVFVLTEDNIDRAIQNLL